jgi:hypothetical protein
LMFMQGPLAWDGALAFWLRVASYGIYVVVMFFAVRAALDRQARERAAIA